MAADPGTVFLLEEEEQGGLHLGEWWLLGTYSASHQTRSGEIARVDGLPLADALAWGSERSTRVVVGFGDLPDRYWVGEGKAPRGTPDGRPHLRTHLGLGRRRHPAFAHLDRPADAPAIGWWVDARIGAPWPADRSRGVPSTPEMDDAIAAAARAAGVEWDREERDRHLRRRPRSGGWFSYDQDDYRMRFTVRAVTHADAVAAAKARLALPPTLRLGDLMVVPEGWVAPYVGSPFGHPS